MHCLEIIERLNISFGIFFISGVKLAVEQGCILLFNVYLDDGEVIGARSGLFCFRLSGRLLTRHRYTRTEIKF